MEPVVNLEFVSDTPEHLRDLEERLKHLHDVKVDMLKPRDTQAPVLISIGVAHGGERGLAAARSISQTLYSFLHEEGQRQVTLVTLEGERYDANALSSEEIDRLIVRNEGQ